jgi:hypothetical protein
VWRFYVCSCCNQEFDTDVVRDADDPEAKAAVPHVVQTQPGPESAAPVVAPVGAQPARTKIPRIAPAAGKTRPAVAPAAATVAPRERCQAFDTPDGCRVKGCDKAHAAAKDICLAFNSKKGCSRPKCDKLHVSQSSATRLSNKHCRFYRKPEGCKKGVECPDRHTLAGAKVVLPPRSLCDLKSSSLIEYAPTRDNVKFEHGVCSVVWSRVNDATGAYPGEGPHIQMVLYDVSTHGPLGVLVYGGSVCLEWMANGCLGARCDQAACNFWHAPLGSLHSGLARDRDTHRLMQGDAVTLSIIQRRVSIFLNQPIFELGGKQAARLKALVDRNNRFDLSARRAAFSQLLMNETDGNRDVALVKRRQEIEATKYTIKQLKDILSDDAKIMADEDDPTTQGAPPVQPAVEVPTSAGVDMLQLLADNDDDQESVATQRTSMQVAGVLKNKDDYVAHAASLRCYDGERLRKALIRYPADAQRAFNKYAEEVVLHHEREKGHAVALHAYNVDLRDYRLATFKDAGARSAARSAMAEKYRAFKKLQQMQNAMPGMMHWMPGSASGSTPRCWPKPCSLSGMPERVPRFERS